MVERGRIRLGWELVHVLQDTLVGLESTASRVLAAEVAGTITLWTGLHTFESGPPEVMAWISLVTFVTAICILGVLIRPRRVVRFWDSALPDDLFAARKPATPEDEAKIIEHVSAAMRAQRDRLERGITVAVPLGTAGLVLLVVAYALERAFYSP